MYLSTNTAAISGFAFLTASCAMPTSDTDPSPIGVEQSPLVTSEPASDGHDEHAKDDCGKQDMLYVGDIYDNTVKRFDAYTGAYCDTFVNSGSGGLSGPRGLVFNPALGGDLLVVGQNPGTGPGAIPGEILLYHRSSGDFISKLVSHENPKSPWQPRGMIVHEQVVYVADMGSNPGAELFRGQILRYGARTGAFIDTLPLQDEDDDRPRAVVIGPDGALYVSIAHRGTSDPLSQLGGSILRYNPRTGDLLNVVVSGDDRNCDHNGPGSYCKLNRPEGLTFGPDGRLYVTSLRADSGDTDTIQIFEIRRDVGMPVGTLVDTIQLDQVDPDEHNRAFAQAIVFGPNGDLFVPILGPVPFPVRGYDVGAIRRYYNYAGHFVRGTDNFVDPPSLQDGTRPNGKLWPLQKHKLGAPWYLTFGYTNPATLAYEPPPQ